MPDQQLKAHPWLSREQRAELLRKHDAKGLLELFTTWGWIIGAFALVYFYPNPLTIFLAVWILGGKQLGCAILMHDCSHQSLFRSPRWNDRVGRWLAAYPIFNNLDRYRPYHLQHHLTTGLEEDPDLLLTRGYPTSRASMIRKFARDLLGVTGIKALIGLFAMHLGYLEYNLGNKVVWKRPAGLRSVLRNAGRNLAGPLAVNGLMLGIFWWLGAPWLYLLWIGAYLSTFQFCLRVRSIAEHSVVPDATDPYRNTRTTYANFLERLLFAPHHVNYHLEHHMLMAVPPYHLPKMHRMLRESGFYREHGLLARNYAEVLWLAAGRTPG